MPIKIHLNDMMSKRKISLNELSQKVGITLSNLSIIKNQKCRAIRLSTLAKLCEVLDCQPGDLIEYVKED
ncbi:helix-turn-helix domain-containing protein [Sphingobacterium wenxiniae]|uniref:Putative transcriptional regulator n=2 Tax=Sphingobacterium wenxiniae TaxID=683125 RepID=A0A1I6PC82_9SPHI|nr:helix-turn-helix transcriptional regulator [Sphingobacterium wenxiniae]SFS37822.1 putative transcriptional regulator [Sphingobacterium wenxiniae]